MTEREIQENAFALYTKLLEKGFLNRGHELVIAYNQEEGVRKCIMRLAKAQGTDVFESGGHIHLITLPDGSLYATSYSQAAASMKKSLEVIDWYIISFVQLVFCWEIDNDYAHKLSIEREGVTYPQLEEKVTKLLEHWKKINDETDGNFSEEFMLAIERVYDKWEKLQYKKTSSRYSLHTRLGLINKAMSIFKEGKLVYISDAHRAASIVYPTDILYERLEFVFKNLDRYQMLKNLLSDALEEEVIEVEILKSLIKDSQQKGGTA